MAAPTEAAMTLMKAWEHIDKASPHVKVFLLSGEIIGFPSLGSTQESVLTFPADWHVSDVLGRVLSRKAEKGEIPYATKQLEGGSSVGFVQVPGSEHMQLYHSNMSPAFGHELMGSHGQDTMYALISADGPQPHTNLDETLMEPNTNLDGVETPTTPASIALSAGYTNLDDVKAPTTPTSSLMDSTESDAGLHVSSDDAI